MGGPAATFLPFKDRLIDSAAFCLIDRPGLGHSPIPNDYDGSSFTSGQVLSNLLFNLVSSDHIYSSYFHNKKLVLASHSIAGANDRIVYNDVASLSGALLFDATTHHCLDRSYAIKYHNYTGRFLTSEAYGVLFDSIPRPLGTFLRGFGAVSMMSYPSWAALPDHGPYIGGFYRTEKHQRAWARELSQYRADSLELISEYLEEHRPGQDDRDILEDKPVHVFSAGKAPEYLPLPEAEIEYWGGILQSDHLLMSSRSVQHRCVDCDHFMMSWNMDFVEPIVRTFLKEILKGKNRRCVMIW
ncbi:hypothetical protein GEMRC1_011829 [Eukaryota sp. GEM-RC1]